MIPFNKPYISGNELRYIEDVISSGNLSGNGKYARKCEAFFEEKFGFRNAILTTSCTDALEMAAMLIEIGPDDEVIIPSYTYVSTANVFEKFGAKIVFADSKNDFPNIDEDLIENLITPKTKAIVPVHYGGVACNMDRIIEIAKKNNIFVIEDAAMAIDSTYISPEKGVQKIGGIGHFSAFSFHETKNITSGEGGMLIINDNRFIDRAEIIRDKGTNKKSFLNDEVNKYEWVDLGGSFSPNELTAAFLFAQLEKMEVIQQKRLHTWQYYYNELSELENDLFSLPIYPDYGKSNGHNVFIICKNQEYRDLILSKMKNVSIHAAFHYSALHTSKYFQRYNSQLSLPNSEKFSDCLLRLPFFTDMSEEYIDLVVNCLRSK
jgi:dTDP-4-amino-4,6-dideoxygalactose transaminase